MRFGLLTLLRSIVASLAVLALAGPARAQEPRDPGGPRALIVVVPAVEGDAFLPAWLYEVAAGELRGAGWYVPPRNAAATLLTRDAAECASHDECLRDLAVRARAPLVLLVRLGSASEGRASATWVSGRVDERALTRSEEARAEGDETALASALRDAAAALARGPKPCAIELAAPRGLLSEMALDARPLPISPRLFVAPGVHAIRLGAAGRAAFDGTLECREGRALRITVR